MDEIEILKELFDEKVVKIINLFFQNPEKQFYLSEISNLSKVNITTTFRILNRLVNGDFVKLTSFGKIKLYQLAKNEKMRSLSKVLVKGQDPIRELIERIKVYPKVKTIILESKTSDHAKILLVVEYIDSTLNEKIAKICREIDNRYGFHTEVVELSDHQFHSLKKFDSYNFDKKIIWARNHTSEQN